MSEASSRADARLNRQRLLDAARGAIAERGAQAEIKEIAERAGVGVGTFYRNFGTKDELIQALIRDVMEHILAALGEAEAMERPRDGLLHLFQECWRLADEHGGLFDALIDAGYEKDDDELVFKLRERVRGLLQRGIARGEFRADVPEEFMADFLDQTLPYVYLHLRHKWGTREAGGYCDRLLLSALMGGDTGPKA